jgi:CBS domain-containing protein
MREPVVRDLMHEGVVSCAPEATVEQVATRMRERAISALVVVRDGIAVGVISRTDLVNSAFIQPYLRYWHGLTAGHLMTSPVVSIRPEAPLAEALALLRSRQIHRLVVTQPSSTGERPVGILSLTDIVRALGDGTVDRERVPAASTRPSREPERGLAG